MTTSMIAWPCTMRTPLTTSTDTHMSAHGLRAWSRCRLVHSFTSSRAHAPWLKCLSLSPIHMVIFMCECVLFTLILLFCFLHFLTSLTLFLQFPKHVVKLHNSANESMDSTDEFSLSTGYEPKAHDFYETSVEPFMQFLDSPPLFSNKVSSADPDYDDAALEDMLHQAHRAQVHHSLREDLTVSLSSSSMSDRTGRPVGDRPGRPGEHRNSEVQIRTLLDNQKEQILAECQARINQHEFQATRAEEDQQLLQGQLLQQNLELREAHQRSLTEMEELRKFQSSTFHTIARRRLVEDQEHDVGTFWPNTGIAK